MKDIDKKYLLLQLWDKVHQKSAAEFQSFFEEIMQKAYPTFQKIRPYGKEGDRGNDGYRPDKGIYYQVYSPRNPNEKEAEAAQKFKNDFDKLKENWDQIAGIKEVNFVFNDKGAGISIELERAASDLKRDNKNINFKIFTSHHLEQIFLNLSSDQISSLGFDVDLRNTLRIVHEYINKLEFELDKDNIDYVSQTLTNIKDLIVEQGDEGLTLEYELMEARVLQKAEKVIEAREKYEGIFKRYPNDPRALLYLAEICIHNEDFEKNKELLVKAEGIDQNHWLLHVEKLIRDMQLGNEIDPATIDEQTFPDDPRIKSIYYRLYSQVIEKSGDPVRADSFMERAIYYNPDRFSNYDVKFSILIGRVFSLLNDRESFQDAVKNLLFEVEALEKKFTDQGHLGPRNKSLINVKKQQLLVAIESIPEFEKVVKDTFHLALECYFDTTIDKILAYSIHCIKLPQPDFQILLEYLLNSEKPVSDMLTRDVILQFIRKNSLFTDGREYFEKTNKQDIVKFINDFETENYEAITFINQDIPFALGLAQSPNVNPELRRRIIEELPDDKDIQKEKLILLLTYDIGEVASAFEILKKLDLSKLSYVECRSIIKIAQDKKAWDYILILYEKLLQYEKDKEIVLHIKLLQFEANLQLGKYPDVINIGEAILSDNEEMSLLQDSEKEMLLHNTLYALKKRGEYPKAYSLLEKHNQIIKSFDEKISIEIEVYLANNDPESALKSVIDAIKVLKVPSPEQYGSLFFIFIRIGHLMDFKLSSLSAVVPDCFMKLKNQNRWFYIGEGNELDATKITEKDETYLELIGKKIGDKVTFTRKYRSEDLEYEIEEILSLEKYVLWQSRHNAFELSIEQRWDKMEVIEVPKTELTIDTKYIAARLEDDRKRSGEFFELYCQQAIPLALLATNEGGLTNAIGRIVSERKGYIKSSTGTQVEFNEQKEVARKIISNQEFYIDGTSAFVLSETGLMEKLFALLAPMKVPQSVISLLFECIDKFRYIPGQAGYLGYSQGRLTYTEIDETTRETTRGNLDKSIRILESKPENIEAISLANKSDHFSEQKVLPSLSDACILAQYEDIPILTEDFLYLKVNEMETGKKAPKYCSSLALLRVLYEQKKINFDDYLSFFHYLSSYRFRFLPISVDDLRIAILGESAIIVIQPKQLRKFNFQLTLAEEYGVSLSNTFKLLGQFLTIIMIDDSIIPEVAEDIFAEVLSAFSSRKNRNQVGRALMAATVQSINRKFQGIIPSPGLQKRIDILSNFVQTWATSVQAL